MKTIIIDFSGWLRVSAKQVKFEYWGIDAAQPRQIDGETYLGLSEQMQAKYVLTNLAEALQSADKVEYEVLEVDEHFTEIWGKTKNEN